MAWRAWRSASAVTAQVLTITASASRPRRSPGADHLGFIGVEPAAEGDDLDAVHCLVPTPGAAAAVPAVKSGTTPRTSKQRARSSGYGRRLAPVDRKLAARQLTVTLRPVSRLRGAPLPRRHRRRCRRRGSGRRRAPRRAARCGRGAMTRASAILARSGNSG